MESTLLRFDEILKLKWIDQIVPCNYINATLTLNLDSTSSSSFLSRTYKTMKMSCYNISHYVTILISCLPSLIRLSISIGSSNIMPESISPQLISHAWPPVHQNFTCLFVTRLARKMEITPPICKVYTHFRYISSLNFRRMVFIYNFCNPLSRKKKRNSIKNHRHLHRTQPPTSSSAEEDETS